VPVRFCGVVRKRVVARRKQPDTTFIIRFCGVVRKRVVARRTQVNAVLVRVCGVVHEYVVLRKTQADANPVFQYVIIKDIAVISTIKINPGFLIGIIIRLT
jgi:hypothetical protein